MFISNMKIVFDSKKRNFLSGLIFMCNLWVAYVNICSKLKLLNIFSNRVQLLVNELLIKNRVFVITSRDLGIGFLELAFKSLTFGSENCRHLLTNLNVYMEMFPRKAGQQLRCKANTYLRWRNFGADLIWRKVDV